jgi:biopolymer transport protein TolQ
VTHLGHAFFVALSLEVPVSFDWILHSGPIAMAVLGLLVLFSVVSWAIIFYKWRLLAKATKGSVEFTDLFWKLRRFDEVYEISKRYPARPVAQIFQKGYLELAQVKKNQKGTEDIEFSANGIENVEHALRRSCQEEMSALEQLVPFLATVGSTSPFIGLFGTVVGIMNSFAEIGAKGTANLATVAPGIAEALVATAAGLLAAIPAVMAYNYFSTRIRSMSTEMENFSGDFLNIVRRHMAN